MVDSLAERLKGSKAFTKAMADAAAAAEQMDIFARNQSEALQTMADAMVEQSRATTQLLAEMKALVASVAAGDGDDDEGAEVAAIEKLSTETTTALAALTRAVSASKPAADDDTNVLRGLAELGFKIDALFELMSAPVDIETDAVGNPKSAVRRIPEKQWKAPN